MNNLIGKIPPNNIEIEKAILGAALLENQGCKIACELLTDQVFYLRSNSIIFNAIKTLYDAKQPVDILTITQELKKIGELVNVGGAYEVTLLTSRVASATNIEIHCRIILQLFFKRELIRISSELHKDGYDDFSDVFDVLNGLKKKIKDIESYIITNKVADNNIIIDTILENIEEASKNGGITGYSTGIKSFDLGIMGLRPQLKYVFGALPGEGKSSLLQTLAVNLTHIQGIPGVVFSLEVPKEMFMTACISKILNIPNDDIQKGNLTFDQKNQIKHIKNTLFTNSLIIDDRGGIGPDQMWPTLIKLKESHKIKWFGVDYLGIEKLRGTEHRGKNEEAVLNYITAEHKIMCKELDLFGFELVQFTKETRKREGAKPSIGDLKGSSGIEANADVIVLIYRPELHGIMEYKGLTDTTGFAELIIAKNRFGPIKNLITKYEGAYTKFSEHNVGNEFVAAPIYQHNPF